MAPYTKEEDFDATTFTVNPEPFDVGGIGTLVVQGVICLLLLSSCTYMSSKASDTSAALILWTIGAILAGLGFYVPYRRTRRLRRENAVERSQIKLHAGDNDVRVGDSGPGQRVIPYANLHRLVVGNSLDGHYMEGASQNFVAVGGSGIVGGAAMATTAALAGAANIAARAHAVRMQKYARVCFQLKAEASGVSHILAGGMTEAAAHGLMQDLSKAIQERNRSQ